MPLLMLVVTNLKT